ncbi:MAG: YdeI/OmpD-associated family protein [Lentibacter algarum]|uniref:YdeI/OmpD-associated family protein n=1 Tax=Lentibacter algarum TaxID=576131 RepID=UPI003BAE3F13
MMDHNKFERVEIKSEDDLWQWLQQYHGNSESVWLVTWKAAHPDRYVSRDTVLDALIAHGWIDGRRLKLDDTRTMQLISPRKQQVWAQTYKDRAERLRAEGKMHPAGDAAIEDARRSGRWTESELIDALVEPDDLTSALEANGGLLWWQAAAPSYRRNVLRWISGAKKPETRVKRIDKTSSLAAQQKKVPQF